MQRDGTASSFYSKKSGRGNNYNFGSALLMFNGTMPGIDRRASGARDAIAKAFACTEEGHAQVRKARAERRTPQQATDSQARVEFFPIASGVVCGEAR